MPPPPPHQAYMFERPNVPHLLGVSCSISDMFPWYDRFFCNNCTKFDLYFFLELSGAICWVLCSEALFWPEFPVWAAANAEDSVPIFYLWRQLSSWISWATGSWIRGLICVLVEECLLGLLIEQSLISHSSWNDIYRQHPISPWLSYTR